MITKYIVKDDSIELYEEDELVNIIPNTESNVDMPRLCNNLIFVTTDIAKSMKREQYFNVKLKRSAVLSLVFGVLTCINLGTFNSVVFFMLMFNLFNFVINRSRHMDSARRLSYYQNIEKDIKNKMINILNNQNNEQKSDTYSLEFTNDQIVMDHQEWVNKIGDPYDYSSDVEAIKKYKILIK